MEDKHINKKEKKTSPLKFLRRHWHDIGLFSAITAGIYLMFTWSSLVLSRN